MFFLFMSEMKDDLKRIINEDGNGGIYGFINTSTNKKEGKWEIYKNRTKIYEAEFVNGQFHGVTNHYFDDLEKESFGQLESEGWFENGERHDVYVEYYENRNKKQEGVYVKGNKQGEWKYYHENGELESIGMYNENWKTGKWKYYHDNKILKALGNYVDNERVGLWREWNESKELIEKKCIR